MVVFASYVGLPVPHNSIKKELEERNKSDNPLIFQVPGNRTVSTK